MNGSLDRDVTVLHVDDDPSLSELVATYLERADDRFEVRTAPSPDDGADVLADADVDCIVSDYEMPDTNGIEFLETVRETDPELPFILYTGKGSEEVASEAITAGVTDYIQKDANMEHYEVLANRITNAVHQYRATKAVERTQRRLGELAEKTNDVLWMFSADWDELLFINSVYEDVWGQATDTLRENPRVFLEAIHPDDRPDAEAAVADLASGNAVDLEIRVNPGEDYGRHVWIQAEPIFADRGEVVRIVGFGRDVTERKDREQRYDAIFNHTYQFTGLLEPDGTLVEANLSALEFADVDRSEILGTKLWDAPWFQHSAETAERARTAVERAAQGEFVRDELRVRGADREAVIDFSVRPVRDEDGTVSFLVPEGRDITERKNHEQKRRQIVRRMKEAVIEVDADWRITLVNERVEAFSGLDESDLVGRDFWAVFDAARGTEFEDAYRTAMESREQTSIVGYYSAVDEWFDVDVYPNDDGGLGFYFLSITDHKERQRELERTRDFFEQAERLGNLGAWEFDPAGDLTWTDGTRRIHEVADEYEPTFEEALEFFHSDDRDRLEAAVEAAIEGGETYDLEARLTTAAGNRRWVRTRGDVRSAADRPTVRGYIQDITAQKERETELEAANAQLEHAIQAGAVGTWEWHVPQDRLVVGKEFASRFGVDPERAREGVELDRFTSSIHPEDRDRVEGEIEAAVADCAEYEAEYRVPDASGNFHWVLARGHVECDEAGNPSRFPGVLVDITERKRIERELERQNERLNDFASVVSHDIRNPLNVAQARTELAGEECDSDHLVDVERAHDRIETLIDDLLTLTREGSDVTDPEPVALADLVDQCWATVETADATLVTEVDRTVSADTGRLKQLFENLLRNAVDHGGAEVTVTVGETPAGFYVADDGPGIPPEHRDDVFEPGFSTRTGGTGFGLSIVEEIVDAHGWDIDAVAGADGGVRFEITVGDAGGR